jgi:hypothetical protein
MWNMFLETTFGLIRALWPFLREAVFGRESVKEWLKKNGITLVWMLFVVLMLVVVLKLVSLLNHESSEITTLNTQNQTLQQTLKNDTDQITELKGKRVCPREIKPLDVTPSSYPPAPKPQQPSVQDQAILDQLQQIKDSEEH